MEEKNNREEYELIRERIKTRPINRKKLIRRTVITAAMAVIFGVLACFTFIVLEPVFTSMLSHDETKEADVVEIPLDEDEMLPADMIVEDKPTQQTQIIIREAYADADNLKNYSAMYADLYNLSRVCQRSIVTVAGVKKDVDWLNNTYESKNTTTGLIVANNGIELLILADSSVFRNSEQIVVKFFNNQASYGEVKQVDKNTSLAIVAVPVNDLTDTILDPNNIAKLGNSKTYRLIASPVFAMGRPIGNIDSLEVGIVTTNGSVISKSDKNYEVFATDMKGTSQSNGVIYNVDGEVLGLIYQSNGVFSQDSLSFIGISELKKTIERMSNGKSRVKVGITGTDVVAEAILQGVPRGAYVQSIDMGSPAMRAGIQSGDVITKIDDKEIATFAAYSEAISLKEIGEEVNITISRQSGTEYQEFEVVVTTEEE